MRVNLAKTRHVAFFLSSDKPNFDNQVESEFWGWVGSKTYLTCIANGNPEPVIKWYKDGQDLSQENGYTIIVGESDIPTRAISHLYVSANQA